MNEERRTAVREGTATERAEEGLLREVGQSFSLMGLMALAVGAALGLGLLAARVLG
ncbi:MAG TPA: hypothetical protein VNO34_03785 [Actinomycetota bacterium]|nr:hypothetical protein [Actinomycetota bacterium]